MISKFLLLGFCIMMTIVRAFRPMMQKSPRVAPSVSLSIGAGEETGEINNYTKRILSGYSLRVVYTSETT